MTRRLSLKWRTPLTGNAKRTCVGKGAPKLCSQNLECITANFRTHSWSLSPGLAPSSVEQEGDGDLQCTQFCRINEIMPGDPLLSPWDPYSHTQLSGTWYTKDKSNSGRTCIIVSFLVALFWGFWCCSLVDSPCCLTKTEELRQSYEWHKAWRFAHVSGGWHNYNQGEKETSLPPHSMCFGMRRGEKPGLC